MRYLEILFSISLCQSLIWKSLKKLPDESKSVIDRITYMDDDLNFIYENSLGFSTLLLKSGKLKNNCFKLIEYKETLSASSFSYLSENYLKQLEAYTFSQINYCFILRKTPQRKTQTQNLYLIAKVLTSIHT